MAICFIGGMKKATGEAFPSSEYEVFIELSNLFNFEVQVPEGSQVLYQVQGSLQT